MTDLVTKLSGVDNQAVWCGQPRCLEWTTKLSGVDNERKDGCCAFWPLAKNRGVDWEDSFFSDASSWHSVDLSVPSGTPDAY